MTTIHVYKTDCLGASRVMLQSGWERARSIFVHLARPGRVSGGCAEYPYGLAGLRQALTADRPDGASTIVFHAQSALPLLCLAYLLRRWLPDPRAAFVYDIHDLHDHEPYRSLFERLRYGLLRHYPLLWLERWALGRRNIRVLTVSDGLADTIVERYGCPRPIVVHSAMQPLLSDAELAARSRIPGALLFFGTAERLPFELIDDLGQAGLELHLYGRFDGRAGIERRIGCALPDHVHVYGEYSPKDLDFVAGYRFLLIYKPDDLRPNFIYSLPNKFFQSLAYGTSLIVSPNFEEMAAVASPVPGACAVLTDTSRLADTMAALDALRDTTYYREVATLGGALHSTARERYLAVVDEQAPGVSQSGAASQPADKRKYMHDGN